MTPKPRAFFGYFSMLLVLLAVLCTAGCRSFSSRRGEEVAVAPLYQVPRRAAEAALVEALWSYHEAAVTEVLKGIDIGIYQYRDLGGADFEKAVSFFESVTGIDSGTAQHFGRAITPDLGDKLDLWRQWYQENRGHLYFDPYHCEIASLPQVTFFPSVPILVNEFELQQSQMGLADPEEGESVIFPGII